PTTQCSFCIFLVKTFEDMLPKERTEEICHILPSSYQDQCEEVVGKFTKTVLEAILRGLSGYMIWAVKCPL
uniref:Saposin B-type domain-containing protein n=1 Tax=Monopterus albus TaxID=43700 RepID=A0A3Q3K675_MONAL